MEIQQLAQRLSDPISQQAHQDVLKALEFKKAMRSQRQAAQLAPITQAMDSNSAAYNAATADEDRNKYNALNSLIRANLLKGGFNPTDIDQKYWGNTPGQFQTTGGYEAPVSGYEGLKRTDVMAARRSDLSDEQERRKLEIAISGIDPTTGQKTWDRQLQEMQFALSAAKGSGGGSGGGLTPYQMYQITRDAQTDKSDLYTDARKLADTAVEKSNFQAGTWSPTDLVRAYEEMGYNSAAAAAAAQNDPRNIYNYFINQLGQERGFNLAPNAGGAVSDDDIRQYLK